MKKFICLLLTCAFLLFLCACEGKVVNSKTTEQLPLLKFDKGHYLTAEETASLTVFDTTNEGEIYFEVTWFRANGFGGVAKSTENTAEFEITGHDAQRAKGVFRVEDNEIILELSECTFNYIEAGTYRFVYSGTTYQDGTYCDLSEETPHTIFEYFYNDLFAAKNNVWEFLGTAGEVFTVDGDTYTSILDLYKVKISEDEFKYYGLTSDPNSRDGYGFVAYEVTEGGKLVLVWKSDDKGLIQAPSSGSLTVNESENTETTSTTNSSESNYDKYKDKTIRDIREEYGQEKDLWVENSRKVLVYDDPLIPNFYYSFDLGSGENAFKSLQREPVPPSGTFITGFAAGSKGIEVYKGIKIGDNFNEAVDLLGAITEKRDLLSATSYPNGGRIDWIFDDKGTILYASVVYGH